MHSLSQIWLMYVSLAYVTMSRYPAPLPPPPPPLHRQCPQALARVQAWEVAVVAALVYSRRQRLKLHLIRV